MSCVLNRGYILERVAGAGLGLPQQTRSGERTLGRCPLLHHEGLRDQARGQAWKQVSSPEPAQQTEMGNVCLLVYLRQGPCSFGCPRTPYVDQAGLEFTEISLPLPPSAAGIKGVSRLTWQNCILF